MTTSHLTLPPTAHLPRTGFGMPVLDDIDTNDAWWAMRDEEIGSDERLNTIPGHSLGAIVASFSIYEPAKRVHPAIDEARDPDFMEDGRAYWLSDEAVVSVPIEDIHRLPLALAQDKRSAADQEHFARIEVTSSGWVRIHPNQYGIEVNSYFDHGRGEEAHDAQSAWTLARKAVLV